MQELLTSTNAIGFIAGLVFGIFCGILIGIYIGLHFRNKHDPIAIANVFGGLMALLWAGLHTFAIFSGAITVPFIFDVVGGMAMGQTLGIDLVSSIQKFRK